MAAPGQLPAVAPPPSSPPVPPGRARSSVALAERRLLGDFIDRLLADGLTGTQAERLAREAVRLGPLVPEPAWVLVLEPDVGPGPGTSWREDRVEAALADLVRRRLTGAVALVRPGGAVVVLPRELAPDLAAAERQAKSIQAAVAPPGAATVSIGVGGLAVSARALARSHQEARQALRLARCGGRSLVVTSRALGILRLLLELQPRELVLETRVGLAVTLLVRSMLTAQEG